MAKVRTEVTSVVHSLPWLIADEEGLFAREGIEVEFVNAPQRGQWLQWRETASRCNREGPRGRPEARRLDWRALDLRGGRL